MVNRNGYRNKRLELLEYILRMLLISAMVVSPSICQSTELWSGKTVITDLYPTSGQYIFNVSYSNPISICDNGTRFSISMSNPNYNALVSSLIAAFMAGKEINFNVQDAQGSGCSPEINRFIIYP